MTKGSPQLQATLHEYSITIGRVGQKLVDLVDVFRRVMPPAAADADIEGIGHLIVEQGLGMKAIAVPVRGILSERPVMRVHRALPSPRISGLGGQPETFSEPEVDD